MTDLPIVTISTTAPPPDWALWERYLLDGFYPAAMEFVEKYTRPDGTLIWRDAWPGMDGSDDGYESFGNFPLYYCLGGPEEIHALSRHLWEGVTRQFTAYGQVEREFDGYYDWMHHGESSTYMYFLGLADPAVAKDRERALRFAAMYMGEDPQAENYDPSRQLIRSPINGSRGPRFENTAEDWVTHRPVLADYPLPYDDIPGVMSSDAWIDDVRFPAILQAMNQRMMRGDVPLNLTSTSLVLNAFLYSGEAKYREWVESYADAWLDRTRRNDNILPDNVGLDDEIGQYMDGKWWGGYYGWRWPHGLFNLVESSLIGASNAYLATGDARFLELPRSVFDLVLSHARINVRGERVVPHRHGDQGWYDFRPIDPSLPVHLWSLTEAEEDYARLVALVPREARTSLQYHRHKGDSEHSASWAGFVEGLHPDYPVEILRATWLESQRRMEATRCDRTTPDQQDVHHWQLRNPVVLEGLVQLALGAPNHVYHGGMLHCRLFYFDPDHGRPGLPADVAAMAVPTSAGEVDATLVNLHSSQWRRVVIQGGAFGEHELTRVETPSERLEVDGHRVEVRLAPGACGRIRIIMQRHERRPGYTGRGQV